MQRNNGCFNVFTGENKAVLLGVKISAGDCMKWKGIKKAPAGRQGLGSLKVKYRLTAGTGCAGTGTATASTNRIGRCDGKAGTIPCIDKVDLDRAAGLHQTLVDQKG